MHVVVITLHIKMGSPGHPSWSVGLGKHEENAFPIIPQGHKCPSSFTLIGQRTREFSGFCCCCLFLLPPNSPLFLMLYLSSLLGSGGAHL